MHSALSRKSYLEALQRSDYLLDAVVSITKQHSGILFEKQRVFDASIDFRLPNRRGSIELTAKNLLDEEFRFQDTDPENPHVFPDRFFAVRFSLSF